jgi:hypothetical protein
MTGAKSVIRVGEHVVDAALLQARSVLAAEIVVLDLSIAALRGSAV